MSLIQPLPEELQKVAYEELGEVPERIPADLKALKAWIQQQPHLKARLDDQFLVQFLRDSEHNVELAKAMIDRYYSSKSKHICMRSISDVDEPKVRQFHNTASFVSLPTPLNGNGPRIFVLQMNFSPHDFTTDEIFQFAVSVSEVVLMNDPYACIMGVVFVIDYAKATPSHLRLLTPSVIKNVVTFFENILPIRIRSVYCINLASYTQKVANFILKLLPQKLRQRIFICGRNIEDLSDEFSKKYLPRDYGGENGSVEEVCAEFKKVWDEYREFFKENVENGAVECLPRPQRWRLWF